MAYQFITSCVDAIGDDINEMVSIAKDLPAESFLRLAKKQGFYDEIIKNFAYADLGLATGKTPRNALKDDWSVQFGASYYQGVPCVYFQHSRIEYIYMDEQHAFSSLSAEQSVIRQKTISELSDEFCESCDANDAAAKIKPFLLTHASELTELRIPATSLFAFRHGYGDKFKKVLEAFNNGELTK